jgi:hypothetical protein
MSEPITHERLLEDMRTARYVTNLCVEPSTPKFRVMLADTEFAKAAEAIVHQKIAAITDGTVHFNDGSSREKTLAGWERTLDKITETLYPELRKIRR